jgi:hypothetical protein
MDQVMPREAGKSFRVERENPELFSGIFLDLMSASLNQFFKNVLSRERSAGFGESIVCAPKPALLFAQTIFGRGHAAGHIPGAHPSFANRTRGARA